MLMFHPLVQITAVVAAFGYGVLYIVLSSFADLWSAHYHQPLVISGLHYIAVALGELIGSQVCGKLMDASYCRMKARSGAAEHLPEHRIPLTLPGAIIAPLGLFIYGWTAQYRAHVGNHLLFDPLSSRIDTVPLVKIASSAHHAYQHY